MTATTAAARRTPLHAYHLACGAKLVPFAGYAMPLQYPHGIVHEHLHTRASAGLFDVSHMGQVFIDAPAAALEALVPGDLAALPDYRQRYTVLTNERGGIIDDLMIMRLPGRWYAVVNAAFRDSDRAHLAQALAGTGTVTLAEDRALLALQGPAAAAVLAAHCPRAAALPFMAALEDAVAGVACLLTRSGYTGEDGFEIACAADDGERLARALAADPRVEPVGLGARDSLRLEAGLCLSGTDIDPTTNPVEAGLGWLVAKKYRGAQPEPARFPGADRILRALPAGSRRVRVGLKPAGRVPLRGGTALSDAAGDEVGRITSGSFGPTAGHPVAMGYVERRLDISGTALTVSIRGRTHAVEVAALPFVPHRYFRS
jgi:aminomethyltransferase